MKKHQNLLRFFTLMLSTILLFVFLPCGAIAEGIGGLQISSEVDVYEVEELRQENVKHFHMGDGQYTAVTYNEAVHRKDAAGAWQDIDNSLALKDGYHSTGDGRVKFAANANSGDYLMALSENGYGIELSFAETNVKNGSAYSLQSTNSSVATVVNPQKEEILATDSRAERYRKLATVNNKTTLSYANVLSDVDVEYQLSGNSITETFTLKGGQSSYELAFLLNLSELGAVLSSSDRVTFFDRQTGEAVYAMTISDIGIPQAAQVNAVFTLKAMSNHSYLLTVTTQNVTTDKMLNASAESLTVGSDSYVLLEDGEVPPVPVVTITLFMIERTSYTTYIHPNVNETMTNQGAFCVGDGYTGFMYMEFPVLPDDAALYAARFLLSVTPYNGDSCTLFVDECIVPWYEYDSWTYYDAMDVEYSSWSETRSAEIDGYGQYEVDITPYAMSWWYSAASNHGVVLTISSGVDYVTVESADMNYLEVDYYFEPAVQNGVYYLQNAQHALLMQRGSGTGAAAYNGTDEQKWKFTFLDNGFYAITTADGKQIMESLGMAEWGVTFDSITAAELNDQLPDNQQWRLKPSNGGYVLVSKEDGYWLNGDFVAPWCLGIENGNGSILYGYMYSNTDATTLNEVWHFGKTVLHVRYDEAYVDRYGGDSTSSATRLATVKSRITGHIDALRESLRPFGIQLVCSLDTTAFECYGCMCNCAYNALCEHTTDNRCQDYWRVPEDDTPLHHTNINNIRHCYEQDVLNELPASIPTVLFIGHALCDEDDHDGNIGINGWAREPKNLALIFSRSKFVVNKTDSTDKGERPEKEDTDEWADTLLTGEEFECKTVLHEVGHLFGAPDHYEKPENSNDGDLIYTLNEVNAGNVIPNDPAKGYYADLCIYGCNRKNAITENIVCPGCQIRWRTYAHKYDLD